MSREKWRRRLSPRFAKGRVKVLEEDIGGTIRE